MGSNNAGERRRRRIRVLQEQRDYHDAESANEERSLGARSRHQKTMRALNWACAIVQVLHDDGTLEDVNLRACDLIDRDEVT